MPSRTVPDPDCAPSDAAPPKPPRKAKAKPAPAEAPPSSDHVRLVNAYEAAFLRAKGVPHHLPRNQWSRATKAFRELLELGIDEAIAVVTRALADPWTLSTGPEPWAIVASMGRHRGRAAARAERMGPQGCADPLAAAARIEAACRTLPGHPSNPLTPKVELSDDEKREWGMIE